MKLTLKYQGASGLNPGPRGVSLMRFAPNLGRDPVAFDAPLKQPLRFREAISALHDVVVNDLAFKPRDKTAYEAWKAEQQAAENRLLSAAVEQARQDIENRTQEPISKEFEKRHKQLVKQYWKARLSYNSYLMRHQPEIWRQLVPCDPVITVADDVVFFECFSADESSYGCLTVNRDDGFGYSSSVQRGTTNVDYSWALYDHFQSLRSYRETRCLVDPDGFGVATTDADMHREEKIDLPPGWLRGFMQLQSAMALPMTRVSLSREVVYNLLAWLKRHRARTSPRAIRFDLQPGRPPRLILEPWERELTSHGTRYDGPPTEPIRIWGRRRLLVLERLLPLAEGFDVYLLGNGLPSFWVARLGEMRFTLGLSGWTANDWTRVAALDLLAPPATPSAAYVSQAADILRANGRLTFDALHLKLLDTSPDLSALHLKTRNEAPELAAALNQLARTGQSIYDLDEGVHRWRQIMPNSLGEAELGPEHPELAASRSLIATLSSDVTPSPGLRLVAGTVPRVQVEAMLDGDGAIRRAKCDCSFFRKGGLKMGPCRHLLALRRVALNPADQPADNRAWYQRFSGRSV